MRQKHSTLLSPCCPQSQIPPASAAAAAAPKHIVVASLGVLAGTELWCGPAMMDVLQQLSVALNSVRMAIAVNTDKTTLTFGELEGCRVIRHLNRSHNSGFGASQRVPPNALTCACTGTVSPSLPQLTPSLSSPHVASS